MFVFSEFNSISKAEISELIETKTKMMETEIELIKAKTKLLEAKCLSEAEIIKLIKSNSIRSAAPVSRGNARRPIATRRPGSGIQVSDNQIDSGEFLFQYWFRV